MLNDLLRRYRKTSPNTEAVHGRIREMQGPAPSMPPTFETNRPGIIYDPTNIKSKAVK